MKGHVDFTYEVSRSLRACQGAVLLVDASKGIQAQTMANFWLAFNQDLTMIPVLNKIDLPGSNIEKTKQDIQTQFELNDCLSISAKNGINVESVLEAVIERIPCPKGSIDNELKCLLFDCWYDEYKGTICMISVIDGILKKGDIIESKQKGTKHQILEIGVLTPEMTSLECLRAGQVGFIICGMKTTKEALIGDTFCTPNSRVEAVSGFQQPRPMVYSGIFPADASEYSMLETEIQKLLLNDSSVSIENDSSHALGRGFRAGFLGVLHMDVFKERLENEHNMSVIATNPTVPFKILFKNGEEKVFTNPIDFPDFKDSFQVADVQEPFVLTTVITPREYLGKVIKLCNEFRGIQEGLEFMEDSALLKFRMPLNEIVSEFYDRLKSVSSGYATFEYDDPIYESSDICKVGLLINGEAVDALSQVCHRTRSLNTAKELVRRLASVIKRHQFEITVQAKVDSQIVAKQKIKQLRKDVTAKCYGGDGTRKKKLLDAQKEGKKKMRMIGSVEVGPEAFLRILT